MTRYDKPRQIADQWILKELDGRSIVKYNKVEVALVRYRGRAGGKRPKMRRIS
jgi:hypothetical protein